MRTAIAILGWVAAAVVAWRLRWTKQELHQLLDELDEWRGTDQP